MRGNGDNDGLVDNPIYESAGGIAATSRAPTDTLPPLPETQAEGEPVDGSGANPQYAAVVDVDAREEQFHDCENSGETDGGESEDEPTIDDRAPITQGEGSAESNAADTDALLSRSETAEVQNRGAGVPGDSVPASTAALEPGNADAGLDALEAWWNTDGYMQYVETLGDQSNNAFLGADTVFAFSRVFQVNIRIQGHENNNATEIMEGWPSLKLKYNGENHYDAIVTNAEGDDETRVISGAGNNCLAAAFGEALFSALYERAGQAAFTSTAKIDPEQRTIGVMNGLLKSQPKAKDQVDQLERYEGSFDKLKSLEPLERQWRLGLMMRAMAAHGMGDAAVERIIKPKLLEQLKALYRDGDAQQASNETFAGMRFITDKIQEIKPPHPAPKDDISTAALTAVHEEAPAFRIVQTLGHQSNCLPTAFGQWLVVQATAGDPAVQVALAEDKFNDLFAKLKEQPKNINEGTEEQGQEPVDEATVATFHALADLSDNERQKRIGMALRELFAEELAKNESQRDIVFDYLEIYLKGDGNGVDTFIGMPFVTKEIASLREKKSGLLKAWWDETGFQQYCKKVKTPGVYLGAEALAVFSKKFGINISYNTRGSDVPQSGLQEQPSVVNATLHYNGSNHWTSVFPKDVFSRFNQNKAVDKQLTCDTQEEKAHKAPVDLKPGSAAQDLESENDVKRSQAREKFIQDAFTASSKPVGKGASNLPKWYVESSSGSAKQEALAYLYKDDEQAIICTDGVKLKVDIIPQQRSSYNDTVTASSKPPQVQDHFSITAEYDNAKQAGSSSSFSDEQIKNNKLMHIARAYVAAFIRQDLPLSINLHSIGAWTSEEVTEAFKAAGFTLIQLKGEEKHCEKSGAHASAPESANEKKQGPTNRVKGLSRKAALATVATVATVGTVGTVAVLSAGDTQEPSGSSATDGVVDAENTNEQSLDPASNSAEDGGPDCSPYDNSTVPSGLSSDLGQGSSRGNEIDTAGPENTNPNPVASSSDAAVGLDNANSEFNSGEQIDSAELPEETLDSASNSAEDGGLEGSLYDNSTVTSGSLSGENNLRVAERDADTGNTASDLGQVSSRGVNERDAAGAENDGVSSADTSLFATGRDANAQQSLLGNDRPNWQNWQNRTASLDVCEEVQLPDNSTSEAPPWADESSCMQDGYKQPGLGDQALALGMAGASLFCTGALAAASCVLPAALEQITQVFNNSGT